MRLADRQLTDLKRQRKQTQKKLRKATRRLSRTKRWRALVSERRTLAEARLEHALASIEDTPPAPEGAPSDGSATLLLPAPRAAARRLSAESLEEPTPPDPGIDDGSDAPDPDAATAAEISALREELSDLGHTLRRVTRRLHRVQQAKWTRSRRLVTIKRQSRAATARREKAERALGGRILSMAKLAQRRAAKKTKLRPDIKHGFAWPTRGRITQPYGCTGYRLNPRRGSCRHFHDGIDVAAYRGTKIRSAAVGVVSYVGWNPWDKGKRAFMVVVAHPGGYETLYGHLLPKRRVRVGQVVRKGKLIGFMGSTGGDFGTHLHLELRRARTALNPLAFF
jgi:murein DD-endopeptidase MepM/ murein hydrolase activator NlpD